MYTLISLTYIILSHLTYDKFYEELEDNLIVGLSQLYNEYLHDDVLYRRYEYEYSYDTIPIDIVQSNTLDGEVIMINGRRVTITDVEHRLIPVGLDSLPNRRKILLECCS